MTVASPLEGVVLRYGQIYSRRGGRGFYFQESDGHLLEVMTVRETGS